MVESLAASGRTVEQHTLLSTYITRPNSYEHKERGELLANAVVTARSRVCFVDRLGNRAIRCARPPRIHVRRTQTLPNGLVNLGHYYSKSTRLKWTLGAMLIMHHLQDPDLAPVKLRDGNIGLVRIGV